MLGRTQNWTETGLKIKQEKGWQKNIRLNIKISPERNVYKRTEKNKTMLLNKIGTLIRKQSLTR